MGDSYPYLEKRQLDALVITLQALVQRDPEQEILDAALPVLDAVVSRVKSLYPSDPVVATINDVISPVNIDSGERLRVAEVLIIATQLQATIGEPKLSVF